MQFCFEQDNTMYNLTEAPAGVDGLGEIVIYLFHHKQEQYTAQV